MPGPDMPNDPFYHTKAWHRARTLVRKRSGGVCEIQGCNAPAVVVDHANPDRPRSVDPADLRDLCRYHDNQGKELAGRRRNGGVFTVIGCDADGWPLDPARNTPRRPNI